MNEAVGEKSTPSLVCPLCAVVVFARIVPSSYVVMCKPALGVHSKPGNLVNGWDICYGNKKKK